MPINPEEIITGVAKVGEAIEKEGGVAKATESIASKGEAVAQDATKSAKTYVRDAKGRFASAAKSAAKTGASSAVGAAAKDALSSKNSSGDSDQDAPQQQGPSKTKAVPNPGANSPAGRIDLPSVTPAEDIAGGVDPGSFADTRGLKGSTITNNNGAPNRKLNKIINLLESILSVEKRNASLMGTGFRNVENAIYAGFSAQANRDQTQQMENSSSGGSDNFFNSVAANPGKYAIGSLKSLGIAALGAFAAGAAIDVIKSHDGKKETPQQSVAKAQEDLITQYKKEYGSHWATKLVADDIIQHKGDSGFNEEINNHQGAAAIYDSIKSLFDKASKKDKQEIIDAIATLLKISPDTVEKQIQHENIGAVQFAKAAETGVMTAAVHATADIVGGGIKYGGKATGWLTSAAGSAFNFFGGYKAGAFLKKEGSTISKNATYKGDELSKSINKATDYIPSTGKMQAFYNPGYFKTGEIGFDVSTAVLGVPGGKTKAAAALFSGGMDFLKDDSAYFGKGAFEGQSDKSGIQPLLDSIGKGESGSKGYDAYYAKSKIKPPKPISEMTLGEIKAWQEQNRNAGSKSTAAGKYQYIYKTLKSVQKELGLPDSTVFSPKVQDQFATKTLNDDGLQKFQQGKISAAQFQNRIAHEWASVEAANGKGVYDNDGINRATNNIAGVLASFDTESLKPQTHIASTAAPSSPITISQGGTNISRNTTIQSATAAAPSFLQDSVAASI